MSELVKETGLRSVDASRMGSNPIPSKEFPDSPKIRWWQHDPFSVFVKQNLIRYSLAVRIGLFHSLDPGSTPGIGIKLVTL